MIKDVACERYFYDDQKLDTAKNKEQYLENKYSKEESKIAPYYVRMIDNIASSDNYNISNNDRNILAKYLVSQIDRTREHREETLQFTIEIYNQLKEKGFTKEKLIQMGINDGQFDKKELHIESIIAGKEMEEAFAKVLVDHIWIIFKKETSRLFYTSDRPIVKYV